MRLKLTGSIGGRNLLEEYNMKDKTRKPEIRMGANRENYGNVVRTEFLIVANYAAKDTWLIVPQE